MKKELIDYGAKLHQKGLLFAADGNLSLKIADDQLAITPTGLSKANLTIDQLAIVEISSGKIIKGQPSSELLMHLTIYRTIPSAKAAIHAHPPTAVALSMARPHWVELPCDALSEVLLATGGIPFVPYARPGSLAMGEVLLPYLPHHKALLLKNHGAITWGDSLEECYLGMERIENSADLIFKAELLGGARPLPPEEITFLKEKRKQIGNKLL